MGIDFLDLIFRIERTFKIRIDRTEVQNFFLLAEDREHHRDIRVGSFLEWVEARVKEQNPSYRGNVAATMKQEIAICLGVDESAVTSDAWMVGDLGMA